MSKQIQFVLRTSGTRPQAHTRMIEKEVEEVEDERMEEEEGDEDEELVVDGSKVTDLCRLPRSRCDAFLAVGGLPAGEKVPGSLLSSVISAGSGRGGVSTGTTTTVVETGTANSRGIGQLELCFPSPVRINA